MTEQLLQYIWQHQYFNKRALTTMNGEPVQILKPGTLNTDQGPDFTNAKIKIGATLWVGSVELHLAASGWDKHHHSSDPNYKNVILHVVYRNDVVWEGIPILELETRIAPALLGRYQQLMLSQQFIPCQKLIHLASDLIVNSCKERVLAERLIRKATVIAGFLRQNKNHWEESFWWLLSKTFGTKVNGTAFEAIAQSLSLTILAKHKNRLIQLEALLLGQAGLLNDAVQNPYTGLLQKEYLFLKSKYNLQPAKFQVHFLRMRPGNFPTVRLVQLAALVHRSSHLFSRILDEKELKKVISWFQVTPNDFWNYHYTLKDGPVFKEKHIGAEMINNIIINTICPVLFAYGTIHQLQPVKDKAMKWLEETGAEKNRITKGFEMLGLKNHTAWDSQAFIELKTCYCDVKKCLQCSIGNAIIKTRADPE